MASISFNPLTNEPYLRLPPPHHSIIITPYRRPTRTSNDTQNANANANAKDTDDISILTKNMNHPLVAPWLISPPFPYHSDHALSWITAAAETYEEFAPRITSPNANEITGHCPFRCIREIIAEEEIEEKEKEKEMSNPNSQTRITQDVLIGCIDVDRYTFLDLPMESFARGEAVGRNMALGDGDERITWTIGYWLAPSHHSHGIMTAVVHKVLRSWAVPRMNARHFTVTTFAGNRGSVKVFEKLGFRRIHDLQEWAPMPESRGGGYRSLHVLGWDLVE